MRDYLEFEKPLADIEGKAEELRAMAKTGGGVDMMTRMVAAKLTADPVRAVDRLRQNVVDLFEAGQGEGCHVDAPFRPARVRRASHDRAGGA